MQRLLIFSLALVMGVLGLDGAEHSLLERSMSGLKPPAMHNAMRALVRPPAVPVPPPPPSPAFVPGAT